MVRNIVAGLEKRFEGIESKMMSSPSLGNSWKIEALSNTLNEIPRIPITGNESGSHKGYGSHIYVVPEDFDLSKTVSVL